MKVCMWPGVLVILIDDHLITEFMRWPRNQTEIDKKTKNIGKCSLTFFNVIQLL